MAFAPCQTLDRLSQVGAGRSCHEGAAIVQRGLCLGLSAHGWAAGESWGCRRVGAGGCVAGRERTLRGVHVQHVMDRLGEARPTWVPVAVMGGGEFAPLVAVWRINGAASCSSLPLPSSQHQHALAPADAAPLASITVGLGQSRETLAAKMFSPGCNRSGVISLRKSAALFWKELCCQARRLGEEGSVGRQAWR